MWLCCLFLLLSNSLLNLNFGLKMDHGFQEMDAQGREQEVVHQGGYYHLAVFHEGLGRFRDLVTIARELLRLLPESLGKLEFGVIHKSSLQGFDQFLVGEGRGIGVIVKGR